jgi:triacylglycerol lipase
MTNGALRWLWPVATFGIVACGDGGQTNAPSTPATTATTSPPVATGNPPSSTPPAAPTPPTSTTAPPAPTGPYPIVLLHGAGGFDHLAPPLDVTYFNGVIADLASEGETQVFATSAAPYDTSEDRAAAIQPQIQAILAQTGATKVNLVGHSQGGMDARVLASPNGLGMGDVIASITTIATPHQGSLVADLALGITQGVPTDVFNDVSGAFLTLIQETAYDVQSNPDLHGQLVELTQSYMVSTFNPKYIDDTRVFYTSYGGRTNLESGTPDCVSAIYADDPSNVDAAQPELSVTAAYLQGTDGTTNDGLVTIASARWGTFMQCVPADHLAEVGQILESGTNPMSGFDHLAFFRSVVARIRLAGF